jgi:hypothetical protein
VEELAEERRLLEARSKKLTGDLDEAKKKFFSELDRIEDAEKHLMMVKRKMYIHVDTEEEKKVLDKIKKYREIF